MSARWSLAGKVALVTGATTGIGRETAAELARQRADVIIVGRDPVRTEAAAEAIRRETGYPRITAIAADLLSLGAVRELATRIRSTVPRLDVLVNNAGAMFRDRQTTADGFERTWAVNHLACALLTLELLPLLRTSAPSRVINVASQTHATGTIRFDDLQSKTRYGAMRAYGQAKLAQVLFTYALARRLEGTGVTVNALHPGVVATAVMRDMKPVFQFAFNVMARPFLMTAQRGAETSVYLASSPDLAGMTGGYFVKSAAARSAAATYDVALQERVWKATVEQVGVAGGASDGQSAR